MEITEAMKKKGWKLVKGTWVAPVEESTKKVSRILIEESRTLGPGWVKVPIPHPRQAAYIAGWERCGLSHEEALVAAGVVKTSSKNESSASPFALLRMSLTRGRTDG
jgi:hypothetical protein